VAWAVLGPPPGDWPPPPGDLEVLGPPGDLEVLGPLERVGFTCDRYEESRSH
jgi:hypothetical protein